MPKDKGKVAIITGSGTGVGAACALQLAERGWNIAINYSRSKDEAERSMAEVKAKGVEAILVQADVGDDGDCKRLVDAAVRKWGRVDGLINNAGTTTFQDAGDLDGVQAADFERIYRINVVGPYQMSRAIFPAMKAQWEKNGDRGSIVNVSSIAGVMGVGSSIPYMCSKGALNTLTLALAKWLAPAVRVNTICPGYIHTNWWRKAMDDATIDKMKRQQEATTPLRNAGTAEQSAEAAIFFLAGASNITGEFLIVDAGAHLGALPMKGR